MSMGLMINATKEVESLLIVKSFNNFFVCESSLTEPHCSACLQAMSPINIIVMFLIENSIHRMHLSKANHRFISWLVIREMLIVNSICFSINFIMNIDLMKYPLLTFKIEKSKILKDFFLLSIVTAMDKHESTIYGSCVIGSFTRSSLYLRLLLPNLCLSIIDIHIIESHSHLDSCEVSSSSPENHEFLIIRNHRM